MRFVAFDIESPDGYFAQGNLCEFGYTIADENFNIITEKNLLIRPVYPITKPNYRIKLDYPLAVYNSAPLFVEYYDHIAELLSDEDTIVIGHAVHNDIFCLNCACKRNTLKPFDFQFIDTQILYSIYKGVSKIMSLDKIADEIGEEFTHHRADEDARMSLLTLKYICEKEGLKYLELLDKYEAILGFVENGKITNFSSTKIATVAPSIGSKNSKRRLLSAFLPVLNKKKNKPTHLFYNKGVAFDSNITLQDINDARSMFQALVDIGGRFQTSINKADFYVTNDETFKSEDVTVINLQKFKELIGDYPQLVFDDETILANYMKQRADRRRKEVFEKRKKYNKISS